MIKKINNAKFELEDSPKGQATIDKLVDHKDRLTQFVNSKADYNNKIQKINTALRRKNCYVWRKCIKKSYVKK